MPWDIGIVTDSTADLPAELVAEYAIDVVPLTVTIRDRSFLDGTVSQAEFFRMMSESPTLPTTSQPSVGAFTDAYATALEHAREIVSIHISSKLSGTVEAARAAAEAFGGKVHVVDSRNLSMGLGFQVLEAGRARAAGAATAEEIVAAVARIRDRVRLIVGVDKLDNLAKGGRIGRVAAFLGGILDLRVLFDVTDGEFRPVARMRGAKAGLVRTEEYVREHMGGSSRGRFAVAHAMAAERAAGLRDALEAAYEATEMHIVETGVVISTHTGTGWGVAFVPE